MIAALAKSPLALGPRESHSVVDLLEEGKAARSRARVQMAEIVVDSIRDSWTQVGLSNGLSPKEAHLVKLAMANVEVMRSALGSLGAAREGLTLHDYDTRLRQIVEWANIWSKGSDQLLPGPHSGKHRLRGKRTTCVQEAEDAEDVESIILAFRAYAAQNQTGNVLELIRLMQASSRKTARAPARPALPDVRDAKNAGALHKLMAAKEIGAKAWDEDTTLQVRVSFHVGDLNAPGPALAHVATSGHMERAPALLLGLVIRTIGDVEGLHRRSGQIMGLGVEDYLKVLGARATGGIDRSKFGKVWALMQRSIRLTSKPPPTTDAAIVVNLLRGQAPEMKWFAMVHLQGPVGDIAQLWAPWVIWDHFDSVLPKKEKVVLRGYIQQLSRHPKVEVLRNPFAAAKWVEKVVAAAGR